MYYLYIYIYIYSEIPTNGLNLGILKKVEINVLRYSFLKL